MLAELLIIYLCIDRGKKSSFLRVYFFKKDYLPTHSFTTSCKNPLLHRLRSWFLFKPKWPLLSTVIISPALTPITFLESIKVSKIEENRRTNYYTERELLGHGTMLSLPCHGNSSTHRTINYHVP